MIRYNRISLIVRIPESITKPLRKVINHLTCLHPELENKLFFDPHVTVAYLPKGYIISKLQLEQIITAISKTKQHINLVFGMAFITPHNTLSIPFHHSDNFCRLHKEILEICVERNILENTDHTEIFNLFNTLNVYRNFSPHMTICQADAKYNEFVLNETNSICLQKKLPMDNIYIADSSNPPLKNFMKIRSY